MRPDNVTEKGDAHIWEMRSDFVFLRGSGTELSLKWVWSRNGSKEAGGVGSGLKCKMKKKPWR